MSCTWSTSDWPAIGENTNGKTEGYGKACPAVFVFFDHLGSPFLTSRPVGIVVDDRTYDPPENDPTRPIQAPTAHRQNISRVKAGTAAPGSGLRLARIIKKTGVFHYLSIMEYPFSKATLSDVTAIWAVLQGAIHRRKDD